jgi:hypothetical protein
MKTGLQLILVFVLSFLALLVARIEYYRGLALFHQHQAERYADMIRIRNNVTTVEVQSALELAAENLDDPRLSSRFRGVFYHRAVAEACQDVAYHPWLIAQKLPPPVLQFED